MIEILLRERIDNLGRRGEVVKVANGYARNYLLPRKLGLPVTEASRRQVEREREALEKRDTEQRAATEAIASRITDLECVIVRMVGETETLYGSVTNADIAEFLTSRQFEIDKRRIILTEPIRALGEFMVLVKLHSDVIAELKVRVVKEEILETNKANGIGSDAEPASA